MILHLTQWSVTLGKTLYSLGLGFISKRQGWSQQSLRPLPRRCFGSLYCHRKHSENRNVKILPISSKQEDSGNSSSKPLMDKGWAVIVPTVLFAPLPRREARYDYNSFINTDSEGSRDWLKVPLVAADPPSQSQALSMLSYLGGKGWLKV